jgi:excinuclease ABC subunit B
VGRAARNINGRAILYADVVTGSMQRAIDETSRRRSKQLEFNAAHGITPRGIQKGVTDVMEGARAEPADSGTNRRKGRGAAVSAASLVGARPEVIVRHIKKLEAEMYRKARNLEFEEAAKIRDEIEKLRQLELGLPASKAG